MKYFLVGFWVMIVAACLMGAKDRQIFGNYSTFGDVETEFENLYQTMQPVRHKIVRSSPTAEQMEPGQVVIFSSGGAISLFVMDDFKSTASFSMRRQ